MLCDGWDVWGSSLYDDWNWLKSLACVLVLRRRFSLRNLWETEGMIIMEIFEGCIKNIYKKFYTKYFI